MSIKQKFSYNVDINKEIRIITSYLLWYIKIKV